MDKTKTVAILTIVCIMVSLVGVYFAYSNRKKDNLASGEAAAPAANA